LTTRRSARTIVVVARFLKVRGRHRISRRSAQFGSRTTRLPRRPIGWALGGAVTALCAVGLAAPGQGAVLVSDQQNDSGACFFNSGGSCGQNSPPAPDLISLFASHTDGDRNSTSDDSMSTLTAVAVDPFNPGAPLNLFGRPGSTDQDLIEWYLDTDGNSASGGLFGAEFRVTLVGQGDTAAPDTMFLNAWNGTTFVDGPQTPFVAQPGVGLFWDLKLVALGVTRGAGARNIGVVVITKRNRQGNDFLTLDALPEAGQALLDVPALPGPPATETGEVASRSSSSLTVTGRVSPGGLTTSFKVEYGTTRALGRETAPTSAPTSDAPVAVSATLPRLAPATTYFYRVVARNNFAEARGAVKSSRTAVVHPDIIESDFPFSRSCVSSGCTVADAPLRVQLRDGDSGRLLGPSRRRAIRIVVKVRGPVSATRRLRLSRSVRVAPLGGGSRRTLRFKVTRKDTFGALDRLFSGLRFTGGGSIEVRIVGKGRLGRLHRVIFTGGTDVRESICELRPGSSRPTACRPRR
jgi:hypothetical protein